MRRMAEMGRLAGMTLLVLAGTGGRGAEAEYAAQPGTALQSLQLSGKVLSVDLQRKTLLLQPEQRPGAIPVAVRINFVVDQHTIITEGARQVQAAELQVGEHVQVEYTIKDGKNIAHEITIQEPAGTASSAAPTTPSQAADPAPPPTSAR